MNDDFGNPLACDRCDKPVTPSNLSFFVTHDYATDGCDCVVGAVCLDCDHD